MYKMVLGKFLVITGIVTVLSTQFKVDTKKFSFSVDKGKGNITKNINKNYELIKSVKTSKSKNQEEIEELTKKTTYLLLGGANNVNESSEDFYKRQKEYIKLRYAPKIPKDPTSYSGYDETSQEYKDDLYTSVKLNGMFDIFTEMKVVYGSFGNIRVVESDDCIKSTISLPNVTIRETNEDNPMEYVREKTNLIIHYLFKELDGEYKLYFILGETTDQLDEYFDSVESAENNKAMQMAPTFDSQLKDLYDFSKLESITDEQIKNIKEKNLSNIVTFNSYYNNTVVASANGFFICDNLVVTTWNYMKESLTKAQFIAAKDGKGNSCKVEGIVVANPETDVVVLKMKNTSRTTVEIGDSKIMKTSDPVFTISSKTGVGLTAQGGIIISKDGYIESAFPLIKDDEGSPLINEKGQVVGINTAKQVNSSTSIAVNSEVLEEIKDKFVNVKYDEIKSIAFKKMKEEYYYIKINEEKVKNDIPKNKWKIYSKIGNVEKNIPLKLVKSSYRDNIVSLRYYNGVPDYISSIQLAAGFRKELDKEGYNCTLSSSNKYIYESNEYKVIIMSEFNYLIIVMVKL